MHHFAKTQTSYNSCSKQLRPFCKFYVTTTNPREFFICSKYTYHESSVTLLESTKHFKVQMLHERYFDPN